MNTKTIQLLVSFIAILPAQPITAWQLVWSDEFNGAAGSPPNSANWNYDLGGGGWGNGEAEIYTNLTQNAFQDGNGNLVIRAMRNSAGQYTSARLQTGAPTASTQTADLSWQYGLIVARIKLPFGKGVWPAFWMLGENIGKVMWPACGEIDIMENFGTFNNNFNINNGTAHGPITSGSTSDYSVGGHFSMPFGQQVNTDFHVYAVEWSENSVAFYVDGSLYYAATPAQVPAGQWPFNNPFFILLNVAIGGQSTFLGMPDANAPFPNQDMLIDYVRVYQSAQAAATPVITPGRVVNAASFLGGLAPGGLATVYGNQLADDTFLVTPANGYPTSADNVTVSVNGVNAPLIYVSPTQINFQIPWETPTGGSVQVSVTRDNAPSAPELVTIAAPQAPSVFLSEFVNGVAWVTGAGCETLECVVQGGGTYQLWANSIGPLTTPQEDGLGAVFNGSYSALEVPGGAASCLLTIGGQPATVSYCGAAPGEIIDQINFIYPANVTSASTYVDASLTIGGTTGYFRLPAPSTK